MPKLTEYESLFHEMYIICGTDFMKLVKYHEGFKMNFDELMESVRIMAEVAHRVRDYFNKNEAKKKHAGR